MIRLSAIFEKVNMKELNGPQSLLRSVIILRRTYTKISSIWEVSVIFFTPHITYLPDSDVNRLRDDLNSSHDCKKIYMAGSAKRA